MLEQGIFRFDRLTVTPNMAPDSLEKRKGVRRVAVRTALVYLTEVRWEGRRWGLCATVRQGMVKRLELRIPGPGKLEEAFAAQNRILESRLGRCTESGLGQRRYRFGWGSICSCMDIKTGECAVVAEYWQ